MTRKIVMLGALVLSFLPLGARAQDGLVTVEINASTTRAYTGVLGPVDGSGNQRVIAGGDLTVSYDSAGLIALTSAGALDLSFHGSGYVGVSNAPHIQDTATSTIIDAAGNIMSGGWGVDAYNRKTGLYNYHFLLMRHSQSGSQLFNQVTTFSVPPGRSVSQPVLVQILEQDLGGSNYIVSVGSDGGYAVITRSLENNGSLDTTFGSSGKVYLNVGFNPTGAVLSGNDILVIGNSSQTQAKIAAFSASTGSLDPSFGNNGILTLSIPNANANAIVAQQDGNLVISGSIQNANADFMVARLTPSGSLDPSFNAVGYNSIDVGANDFANSVLLQSDGSIVITGKSVSSTNTDSAVAARFSSGGIIDSSFGSGGFVSMTMPNGIVANSGALQADGKIVLFGQNYSTVNGPYQAAMVRYTTAGVPDSTWSNSISVKQIKSKH